MQCFNGYSYTHRVNPAPQNFDIELLDSTSGARIMKVTGPLTIQTLFEFQDVARRETEKSVIIDLTSVPYMDSAGLGSIVSVFTSCQRNGRSFAIIGLSDRIRTLFRITRVDGFLPCFTSLEQAEASVTSL
jgi:anti-sigma B factor antagonist